MKYEAVSVDKITIENELYDKNQLILHYKIQFPQFTDCNHQKVLKNINFHYKKKTFELIRVYENLMYHMALDQYKDAMANDFPFHNYEIIINYELTYNQDCILSLYTDKYEYTGGAHGNTIRTSDTWNIKCGRRILANHNFVCSLDYKVYLTNMICKQIATQISLGENWYFEDYCQLVKKNFKDDAYYLRPEGIIFYFQQYEIAPYASGIREFIIPYTDKYVIHQNCCIH